MVDNSFVLSLKAKDASLKDERIALMEEISKKSQRLQAINGAILGIEQLLMIEGATSDEIYSEEAKEVQASIGPEVSLAAVLKSVMIQGVTYSVSQLIDLVQERGYSFGDKNPARAVGFTLMGMQRGKNYQKNTNGQWCYVGAV